LHGVPRAQLLLIAFLVLVVGLQLPIRGAQLARVEYLPGALLLGVFAAQLPLAFLVLVCSVQLLLRGAQLARVLYPPGALLLGVLAAQLVLLAVLVFVGSVQLVLRGATKKRRAPPNSSFLSNWVRFVHPSNSRYVSSRDTTEMF
jgi:hypothetical protein